jgi:hypothetical protein
MIPQPEVAAAVKTLTMAIKEDPQFYIAYQANIAMAFVDEARNNNFIKEYTGNTTWFEYIAEDDLHQLANQAAKRFLDLWCRDTINQ